MTIKETPQFYTRGEVCGILRLSIPTVRNLIRSGQLKAAIVSGHYRISPSDLDAFVRACTVKGEE